MSVPNQYFGNPSHMSAILKRDIARVRTSRPEFYRARVVTQSKIDSDGKVTTTEVKDARAVAITPAYRHRLAWAREWF